MAALEYSVQKAKASREEGEHATVHDMPKKSPSEEHDRKKTTVTKTAGVQRKAWNTDPPGCPPWLRRSLGTALGDRIRMQLVIAWLTVRDEK
ncbi:hypothetical protein ACFVZT_44830 [Streptomyces sp. NPDC058321]|uniref:hypothetical protein n=1 Tax=Streptomyces sp. NPDC058321 TaxID=3346445 RepID=UPI0036F0DAD8